MSADSDIVSGAVNKKDILFLPHSNDGHSLSPFYVTMHIHMYIHLYTHTYIKIHVYILFPF